MKVGFDVGPLKPRPAGVGIYVQSLANAVAELMSHADLAFIGRRPDAPGLTESVDSIERSTRVPYPAWALFGAGRAARRAKVDVLHMTDGLVPLPFRPGRVVLTVLDMTLVERPRDHRIPRYLRIPFVLAAPRFADAVIVPSEATARSVRRLTGTATRRIHVVPLAARPGFSPASPAAAREAAQRHGLEAGSFILVPGTIEPRKNPLGTLRAFERLVSEARIDERVRLAFAGAMGWRVERFVAAVEASPVQDRVRVLGYVPDGDLSALMTGAAVVAYPSFAEGFGFPVVEAMACGAIVVTSNRSSLPEVAGDAAELVDPEDVASIADALHQVIALPAAARRKAVAASIARAATFSWRATAERSIEVWGS
jgi:alpha-1,3-rhamnosyl/mannosyltransferase